MTQHTMEIRKILKNIQVIMLNLSFYAPGLGRGLLPLPDKKK